MKRLLVLMMLVGGSFYLMPRVPAEVQPNPNIEAYQYGVANVYSE